MPALNHFSVQDQSVLITGGANGLGTAYCQLFAQAGAKVAIADIDTEAGNELQQQLDDIAPQCIFVEMDVTDRGSVESAVASVIKQLGCIDILINNAGLWKFNNAETDNPDDWNTTMDLNINGLFHCCQAVGRHMISRKSGNIINISSVSSLIINPPWEGQYLDSSYFASKGAVNHLTRSLAVQWAKHNIRVNAISPGYIDKNWFDPAAPKPDWLNHVPMDRIGQPEELATTAIFLASKAASYITGQIIQVDGGYTNI